mgnify:CR=1 FL=1
MSSLLNAIHKALLDNKRKKLQELQYQNLRFYTKPTPQPFNYFILPRFPSNDSEQTKQELDLVVTETKKRTEQDIQDILLIDKDPLILYMNLLDQYGLRFPTQLFLDLYDILNPIIKELKLYFNRPRPNQIAEFYNINIDVITTKTHHTASYPSGHVAYAKLAEMTAKQLYPDHAEHLEKLTEKVGLARTQQGVHFSSDNNASVQLVSKIYPNLLELVS